MLFGKLFFSEFVEYGHFLGKDFSREEALRKQHDLANLLQVRHNYDNRSVKKQIPIILDRNFG